MRDVVVRAADAADGEVAQAALDAWAAHPARDVRRRRAGALLRPARLRDTFESPLYVGRRWVHDEGGDRLVVNWQAPAARPFYTATPIDPQGVTLRRRFRANGRMLLDIADETLDGSTLDGRPRQRLPARGARAEPGRADAGHRRHDPGRPVPADHVPAREPSRDPGRPRDGQDRGRAPPRLMAPLHGPRAEARGAASWSWGRTASSWSTSRTSFPRSERTPSSSVRSRSSSTASSRPRASRATS